MECCSQKIFLLWPKIAAVGGILGSPAPQPNDDDDDVMSPKCYDFITKRFSCLVDLQYHWPVYKSIRDCKLF